MNSRATSNVHITTGKIPFINVKCHRPSQVSKEVKPFRRSDSVPTNDLLKKGGTLPSVLPFDEDDICVKPITASYQNWKSNRSSRSKPLQTLNRTFSPKEPIGPHKTCQLEKEIGYISSELSKVQTILQSCMTEESECDKQNEQNNDCFSAHDYAVFILEMNGKLPLHPYDPMEFSDNSSCSNSSIES